MLDMAVAGVVPPPYIACMSLMVREVTLFWRLADMPLRCLFRPPACSAKKCQMLLAMDQRMSAVPLCSGQSWVCADQV